MVARRAKCLTVWAGSCVPVDSDGVADDVGGLFVVKSRDCFAVEGMLRVCGDESETGGEEVGIGRKP
jgi:hypothetical protein